MVSTTGLPSGATLATAKKAAAAKAAALRKPRSKPSHPRTSDMVDAAIKALKERGGSSLQAIKKYISASYKLDAEKLAPFIKRYLKSGVLAKRLVQVKGKGAAGSFKLSVGEAVRAAGPSVKAAKKSPAVKVKKSPVKKRTVAKKTSAPAKPKKSSPAKGKKTAAGSPRKRQQQLAAKRPKAKVAKKPIARKPAAKKPAAKK